MSQYTGIREGEVFIGNTDTGVPDFIQHLPTVRLGEVALDIDGKKLPPEYKAMFMSRADAASYDRIMVARFSAVARSQ